MLPRGRRFARPDRVGRGRPGDSQDIHGRLGSIDRLGRIAAGEKLRRPSRRRRSASGLTEPRQGAGNHRPPSVAAEEALVTLPAYTLPDLRAAVETEAWRIEAWGRNVTNQF